MTVAAPLDRDQRERVLAELHGRPVGVRLLGQLVVAHGVPLQQALAACVDDLDAAARTLTVVDKRGVRRAVALSQLATELAEAATRGRSTGDPLIVGRRGHPMRPEQARGALLGAARRAGVPATLAQLRPQLLVAA